MLAMNKGLVVLPAIPATTERRQAFGKVRQAGIKLPHVYSKNQRAQAERDAKRCSEVSGVPFRVEDCLY